jgi:ribosomal protein L44E
MIKVGGEVDTFCTKCELTLAHTVHAVMAGKPVKVECNTCHGVHRFRGNGVVAAARPAAKGAKPARARAEVVPFETLLAGKRVAGAQPYSAKRSYAVDDVVDHPMFGRGFVSAVRDGAKIEVTFRSDVKILVHARS